MATRLNFNSLPLSAEEKAACDKIDFERMDALHIEEYPHLGRLMPTVLPAEWRRLADPVFPFRFLSRSGLSVLASAARHEGKFWLHVSLSRQRLMPSYDDLADVKRVFIGEGKTALMVLPPKVKHVNIHRFCLHLWHCIDGDVTPDFTRGTGSL